MAAHTAQSFATTALLLAATATAGTFTVTTTANSGFGSLRWAIQQANATPGFDVITFNLPGIGPQTIWPLSPLPPLTDPAGCRIDGFSQPGAAPGPNPPMTAVLLVEIAGTSAGPTNGLSIQSDNNVVQGLVVNRFQYDGIQIIGGLANPTADFNVVYCNFVGTDAWGVGDLGNGTAMIGLPAGIHVGNGPNGGQANHNGIDSNIASGNWAQGVWVEGPRQPGDVGFNTVVGNFAGTDITGTQDLGNDHEGIALTEGTHDNVVMRNLASGNDFDGIGLQGFNNWGFPAPPIQTRNNTVENNIVGVDINLWPLPNSVSGIAIGMYGLTAWGCADQNTVRWNVVAHNVQDGIVVVEDFIDMVNADQNLLTQNAIWNNGGLGIDLENDGVTLNDPGDFDSGANQQLNFPVINPVVQYAAGVTTLTGTAPPLATVEFFQASPDPTGYGEGELYIGSVNANALGNWTFTTDRLVPSDFVTATATDSANNTSEFCLNVVVPGVPTLNATPRVAVVRLGNAVNLALSAGPIYANRQYIIWSGVSGVTPGTPLFPFAPTGFTVPIVFDGLTSAALTVVNTPMFANFFATLDGTGSGNATFALPANTPGAVGVVIWFAYTTLTPTPGILGFDFASNPVAVELVGW